MRLCTVDRAENQVRRVRSRRAELRKEPGARGSTRLLTELGSPEQKNALAFVRDLAIVPHDSPQYDEDAEAIVLDRRMGMVVRAALVLIALGLVAVFAVAFYLNPYRDGRTWHEGT